MFVLEVLKYKSLTDDIRMIIYIIYLLQLYLLGKCKYGVYCKYDHLIPNLVPDPQVQYNSYGLPLRLVSYLCVCFILVILRAYYLAILSERIYIYIYIKGSWFLGCIYNAMQLIMLSSNQGAPECSHFLRTGTCKYGPGCKFSHPEPPYNPQAYGSYVYGDAGENQSQYSGIAGEGYPTQFPDSNYLNMEQSFGWNGIEV